VFLAKVPFAKINSREMKRLGFLAALGLFSAVAAQGADARLVSLEGDVRLRVPGGEREARAGEALEARWVLLTGSRSGAKLLLPDQTVIDVGADSSFQVTAGSTLDENERNALMNLDFGHVRASVNRKLKQGEKLEIKTKASVFAVRGTEFVLQGDERTTLSVLEGVVQARPSRQTAKAVDVRSGSQVEVAPTEVGKPRLLSSRELGAILSASRLEDRNFLQSIVVGDPVRTRFRGSSTLKTLAAAAVVPKVEVPSSAYPAPGTLLPHAQLITSPTLDFYPVQVKVKFQ
jgi:hypothetical protein